MSPLERYRTVIRSGLPSTQRAVALALVDYLSDDDGWAWPAVSTLGAHSGYSERAVRMALGALVSSGVLVADARPGETTRYRVVWSKVPRHLVHPGTTCTPAAGAPPPRHLVPPTPAPRAPEVDQGSGPEEVDQHAPASRPVWMPKGLHGHSPEAVADMVQRSVDAIRRKPTRITKSTAKPVLGLWSALDYPEPAELAADVERVCAACDAGHKAVAYLRDVRGKDYSREVPTVLKPSAWASKVDGIEGWTPRRTLATTSANEAWAALRRKIDGRNGYALASPPRQGAAILWRVVKAPPVDDRVWAAVEAVGGWASVVDANEDTRAAWMAAFGGELGAR